MRVTLLPTLKNSSARPWVAIPASPSRSLNLYWPSKSSVRLPSSPKASLTVESFHAWLHQFTAYSDRIPSMPSETFSREMIYQDHD